MISVKERVKNANRAFYDIVGPSYERLDRRRTTGLRGYLYRKLGLISEQCGGGSILDLGCGSGFVSNIARGLFAERYAVDISPKILESINDEGLIKINSDADSIPVNPESIDCVVTFAMLHHCFEYKPMFSEIYRIMRKGGIYYSDHDMDSVFFSRFSPLLKVYRRLTDPRKRFLSECKSLSAEIYELTEFQSEGIPAEKIAQILTMTGFKDIRLDYHWYGLSPLTDTIFGERNYKKGFAPLVRISATK